MLLSLRTHEQLCASGCVCPTGFFLVIPRKHLDHHGSWDLAPRGFDVITFLPLWLGMAHGYRPVQLSRKRCLYLTHTSGLLRKLWFSAIGSAFHLELNLLTLVVCEYFMGYFPFFEPALYTVCGSYVI